MKRNKVIFYTMLSGISTGIGALVGVCLGNISEKMIGLALGYAAGAMLYISVYEMIPKVIELYRSV